MRGQSVLIVQNIDWAGTCHEHKLVGVPQSRELRKESVFQMWIFNLPIHFTFLYYKSRNFLFFGRIRPLSCYQVQFWADFQQILYFYDRQRLLIHKFKGDRAIWDDHSEFNVDWNFLLILLVGVFVLFVCSLFPNYKRCKVVIWLDWSFLHVVFLFPFAFEVEMVPSWCGLNVFYF